MSEHGHAASGEGHGDHHYEYLGEPANEAGPDEPSTPGWLTLLGIGLALTLLLGYIASRPDGKTRAELTPATSASGAAPAAPAANPEAAVRPTTPTFRPVGGMPSAFPLGRPGASAAQRFLRPGAFPVATGTTGGAPAPRPRPPTPAAPQ